jgi:hypothetical protein
VIIWRVPGGWQASTERREVIAHSRSLEALDRKVQDLHGGQAITYQFRTGNAELDQLSRRIRVLRVFVERCSQIFRQLTDQAIMAESSLSERDLGVLTGVSHQRIHQLIEQRRRAEQEQETPSVRE